MQDGCDNRCSFCIIPNVREQIRSMKLDREIAEANALLEAELKRRRHASFRKQLLAERSKQGEVPPGMTDNLPV